MGIMDEKPLASLCVHFYKQESFVEDTVKGALSQTYPNLEIILSDDNSPDGTFEAIKNAVKDYCGPHIIIINKNEKNLGLVPHVNKTMYELSHGEYIFLNGGDDISLPNRVEDGVRLFGENSDVSAVTFSTVVINQQGEETGKLMVEEQHKARITDKSFFYDYSFMAGAGALSFRRSVLDVFGKMDNNCQTEDSVLRFRALLLGGVLSSPICGLRYRVHDNNISRQLSFFDTDLIADQYTRDLNTMYSEIDASLYKKLKKKIRYYRRYRKLLVINENTRDTFYSRLIQPFIRFYGLIHKLTVV